MSHIIPHQNYRNVSHSFSITRVSQCHTRIFQSCFTRFLHHFKLHFLIGIDVGQWLASGLQRPSTVRKSLAVRQKELSEEHRITLKRQNCIENKQNLCNFLFSHFFLSYFYFFLLFLTFFLFFSISKCTTKMDCTTKWAFN